MKSDYLRKLVFKLNAEGKSYTEIANNLDISRNEVINLCNYMPRLNKKKRGPKCKFSKADELRIKRKIASLENSHQRITSNNLKNECDLTVSRRTVRRHMKNINMKFRKITKKICLSKIDKSRRLNKVKE